MYRKITLDQLQKIYFPNCSKTKLVAILRHKLKVFCFMDYDKNKTYYILSDEQLKELEKLIQ